MKKGQHLGIAELDAQHEEIADLLDALREVIADETRQYLVRPTLRRLGQLLATHFEYEELLMQMVSYAHLPQHRKMHRGILNLFDDYLAHPAAPGDREHAGTAIGDKVLGHVMEHDARMTGMVRDYLKTFRSVPSAGGNHRQAA